MPNFELTLTDFTFPKDLPEARSTFRFLVDIRYIGTDDKFSTQHAVLPGLDSYWECEKEHDGEANYVRHATLPKLDMSKIDEWDRLIVLFKAKELHSLQIRVIDIEKTGGFLDKMKEYAGSIVEALIGTAKTAALGAIPAPIEFVKDAFGSAVHDVEAFSLAQIAGSKRQDSLIFKKSVMSFPAAPGGALPPVEGMGTKGKYTVLLNLKITP